MDTRKEINKETRKDATVNDGCLETAHDAGAINHSFPNNLTDQDTRTSKTESSEDIGELTDCKEGYGPHEMNLGPLMPLDLDNLPKPDRTNAFPAGKYLVRFPMAVPPPKAYTTRDGRKIARTPSASEIMATKKPLACYMDGDLVVYEGGLVTYLPSGTANW